MRIIVCWDVADSPKYENEIKIKILSIWNEEQVCDLFAHNETNNGACECRNKKKRGTVKCSIREKLLMSMSIVFSYEKWWEIQLKIRWCNVMFSMF